MEPYQRLDEAMDARRLQLRLNWRQLADAAGISYTALRAIRRGDYRPTALTSRGLDEALRWTPGSAAAVLDGGHHTNLEDVRPERSDPMDEEPAELAEDLGLAQRLLAATVREMKLSPDEADEVWRHVRLELERSHGDEPGDTPQERRNPRAG
jgi:transcriptional regulator with XRE-family HTH domain